MTILTLRNYDWKIGHDMPLAIIAGANVLEDMDEALLVGRHLKKVCEDLELDFCFKASFDKANRSSIKSYRGPGLKNGLEMLLHIKSELKVPICTDIHEIQHAEAIAEVADLVQIPAFLCRQTDLIVATAKAVDTAGGLLHIKKAQFIAPWDCKNIINKVREVVSRNIVILCERGTSFGYNNLVVDPLSIAEMQKLGVPVSIDATHAVQLPGANPLTSGASTGGRRDGVSLIAKACVAAGADAVFLEFHSNPDDAKCDAPCCLPLEVSKPLLSTLQQLRDMVIAASQ